MGEGAGVAKLTKARSRHAAAALANLLLLMAQIFEERICRTAERSEIAGCTMPIGVVETQSCSESAACHWLADHYQQASRWGGADGERGARRSCWSWGDLTQPRGRRIWIGEQLP